MMEWSGLAAPKPNRAKHLMWAAPSRDVLSSKFSASHFSLLVCPLLDPPLPLASICARRTRYNTFIQTLPSAYAPISFMLLPEFLDTRLTQIPDNLTCAVSSIHGEEA